MFFSYFEEEWNNFFFLSKKKKVRYLLWIIIGLYMSVPTISLLKKTSLTNTTFLSFRYEWEGKIENDSELLLVCSNMLSFMFKAPWSGLLLYWYQYRVHIGQFSEISDMGYQIILRYPISDIVELILHWLEWSNISIPVCCSIGDFGVIFFLFIYFFNFFLVQKLQRDHHRSPLSGEYFVILLDSLTIRPWRDHGSNGNVSGTLLWLICFCHSVFLGTSSSGFI